MLHRNLALKIGAVLLAIFLWFWVTINARTPPEASERPWQPPTISVVAARTVPVVLRTEGSLAPGIRLRSVQVDPPVVTIIGPNSRVGAISEVETEALDLARASDGMAEQLSLIVPVGTEVPNSATVTVTIELESAEGPVQPSD